MFKKVKQNPRIKKFTLLKKLIFISSAILVSLLTVIFFKSDLLTVREATLNADNLTCTDKATLEKSLDFKKNILTLKKDDIERDLRKKFLCIKEVTLAKKFPNKIEIGVINREPKAILVPAEMKNTSEIKNIPDLKILESTSSATPSADINLLNIELTETGKSFLVDEEGFVYAELNLVNLPKIIIEGQEIFLGSYLGNNLVNALKALEKVSELEINISITKIFYENIFIIEGEQQIIFDLSGNVDRQLASLQLILQKAKMNKAEPSNKANQKVIKIIDLRFNKPVITYSN